VAVIGGGIGGLVAARALLRRHFEAYVFEAAPELREVGAGVALGPNAMKALRSLDLEEPVRAVAGDTRRQLMRSWRRGRTISAVERAQQARRFGAAAANVHRADLLDVLAVGFPDRAITLGTRASSVATDGAVARARFEDGSEIEADVIVGADGIHSAVR